MGRLKVFDTDTWYYTGYGPPGTSGYSGYSGIDGSTGTSGYSGYSGSAGISGYSGYSGPTGSAGTSGYSGYSGSDGSAGTSGYSGYSGTDGSTGTSGYSGYSGSAGTSGYSGYSGTDGSTGTSGYSGYSGSDAQTSGYSGYSGYSGSGVSGYSGEGTEYIWQGEYAAGSGYIVNDLVEYQGSSYICIQAGTGQTPAIGGTAYWDLLTASGYSGISGYSGSTGTSGYSGLTAIDSALTFIIDGGGSTITTGQKGHIVAPYACTIQQAWLLADQSGSIQIDVWRDTYANYPPTVGDSIDTYSISSATKSQETGLSISISAGDIIAFNVDSVTTITRCTVYLMVQKT